MSFIFGFNTDLNLSDFYQRASATSIQHLNTLGKVANATAVKLGEMSQRYLTRDYIQEKATNAAKARVLPLSNPPGWEDKMGIAHAKCKRLTSMKLSLEKQLKDGSHTGNEVLLQGRYEIICTNLQAAQAEIEYLETQRKVQIGARFAGYVGMLTNTVLPGAGILTGLAITGATTMAQEQLADHLPEYSHIADEERRTVRIGTMITIAGSAASVAFSLLAMPYIRAAVVSCI